MAATTAEARSCLTLAVYAIACKLVAFTYKQKRMECEKKTLTDSKHRPAIISCVARVLSLGEGKGNGASELSSDVTLSVLGADCPLTPMVTQPTII